MGMGSPKFLMDSHVRLQRHWTKTFGFPAQRPCPAGGIVQIGAQRPAGAAAGKGRTGLK